MSDNTTISTCTSSHAIEKGDVIVMTTMRHGVLEKMLALIVGLFYYKHLPRPLKQFIETKTERHTVASVRETTITLR